MDIIVLVPTVALMILHRQSVILVFLYINALFGFR